MSTKAKHFLSKNKFILQWMHIALVLLLTVAAPFYFKGLENPFAAGFLIFVVGTIGFSQNIGLMHEHCHRLPPSPSRTFSKGVVRFLYALGGLSYTRGRLAHLHHHAHLGTPLDPDRMGYVLTTSRASRLRYLFYIGPLRNVFAKVELDHAINHLNAKDLDQFRVGRRLESAFVVATHATLFALLGWFYLSLFAGLLAANVFSNIREMAEHGNNGEAAYVNVRPTLFSMLFLSLPGFWYHGLHHRRADIHYLDLPLKSDELKGKFQPIVEGRNYFSYLLNHGDQQG